MDLLEDVRLRGMGDDVWRGIFGDCFVFASQLSHLLDCCFKRGRSQCTRLFAARLAIVNVPRLKPRCGISIRLQVKGWCRNRIVSERVER